jgi:protocatechuate 3,4-dioxygenase beta subunit
MIKNISLWITIVLLLTACAAEQGQNSPTQALPETGGSAPLTEAETQECTPTQPDMLGPFYEPGAPIRDSVGEGYVLEGTVRAAGSCEPIPGAQVELWLAGPDASYGDDYRATIIAGENGSYRFESHVPPPYAGRPAHTHIRVSAPGYQTLVTQHYPQPGSEAATFDLVLLVE